MNHFKARRRADGRWDYTWANRRLGVVATGYCRSFDELHATLVGAGLPRDLIDGELARLFPTRDKFHSDGHATAEEACSCYRRYLLDAELELHVTIAGPEVACLAAPCEERTAVEAVVGGTHLPLCHAHRTRATVERLLPPVEEFWTW